MHVFRMRATVSTRQRATSCTCTRAIGSIHRLLLRSPCCCRGRSCPQNLESGMCVHLSVRVRVVCFQPICVHVYMHKYMHKVDPHQARMQLPFGWILDLLALPGARRFASCEHFTMQCDWMVLWFQQREHMLSSACARGI